MFPKKFRLTLFLSLFSGLFAVATLASASTPTSGEPPPRNRNLLIVIDGLRPEYIAPERMPNLHALGERGVFGDTHSPAYPSVTRVNSATVSTGSYPKTHGLMHNAMFVPSALDKDFSTGSAARLREFDEATGGRLLTAPSLGEILDENGLRLFVTGSGGSGNTLLQNHRGKGMGIRAAAGIFLPEKEAHEEALEAIGNPPRENSDRTVWSFDSYLQAALSDNPPEVTIVWINETDSAGHSHGVGAPQTLEAVANVDAQIGRVIAAHEENGLTDRVNIFVTTDHGFTTSSGQFSVSRIARESGFGDDDVTVVSNMVFLKRDDPELLARVVEGLQRDDQTGNIYTRAARPGSSEGRVPGTLSTAAIQWDHERSADIIASSAWSDEVNEFGFAGATTRSGVATHGSDSPFDLHIRLVAAGPDIKSGLRSKAPTSNADFTPTILHLLGIEPLAGMDGRVLHELLRDGPAPEEIDVEQKTHQAEVAFPDGFRYRLELDTLQVGSTVYLRGARTERTDPLP